MDLSGKPLIYALDTQGLVVWKPRIVMGCFPTPWFGGFEQCEDMPLSAIRAVHVYQQHVNWAISEVGGAQGGGASADAQVDHDSIRPTDGPVPNLPGLGMILWQPCFFVSVQACDSGGDGFGEAFLGVLVAQRGRNGARERIVPLSAPLHTQCLVASAFARREALRAQIAGQTQGQGRTLLLEVVSVPRGTG